MEVVLSTKTPSVLTYLESPVIILVLSVWKGGTVWLGLGQGERWYILYTLY